MFVCLSVQQSFFKDFDETFLGGKQFVYERNKHPPEAPLNKFQSKWMKRIG